MVSNRHFTQEAPILGSQDIPVQRLARFTTGLWKYFIYSTLTPENKGLLCSLGLGWQHPGDGGGRCPTTRYPGWQPCAPTRLSPLCAPFPAPISSQPCLYACLWPRHSLGEWQVLFIPRLGT